MMLRTKEWGLGVCSRGMQSRNFNQRYLFVEVHPGRRTTITLFWHYLLMGHDKFGEISVETLNCEWYPSQLLYLRAKACKVSWSLCRF